MYCGNSRRTLVVVIFGDAPLQEVFLPEITSRTRIDVSQSEDDFREHWSKEFRGDGNSKTPFAGTANARQRDFGRVRQESTTDNSSMEILMISRGFDFDFKGDGNTATTDYATSPGHREPCRHEGAPADSACRDPQAFKTFNKRGIVELLLALRSHSSPEANADAARSPDAGGGGNCIQRGCRFWRTSPLLRGCHLLPYVLMLAHILLLAGSQSVPRL